MIPFEVNLGKAAQDKGVKNKETLMNCQFCSYKGKNKNFFQKHINTKHGELKSCDISVEKFNTSSELCAHKLLRHKNSATVQESEQSETQKCELCGYSFKTENDTIVHMTREHNFKMCHMCNKTFSCVENLTKHFKKDHEDLEELTPEKE